jgi:hypothetical protein
MCGVRIFEEKIVLCKKGDEITGLDGNYSNGHGNVDVGFGSVINWPP